MNEQQISDIEIIEDSINGIGKLRIPIEMNDEIGNELTRIRRNLMVLREAMLRNIQNMQQTEQPEVLPEEPQESPEEETNPEILSEETVQG